ncbi:hypothetical protein KBC89_00800 [Candidatus Woesebacteria bacterium]|nr:hypothetical protein [Candidatus Woesebacteria bacterium]
MSQRPEGEQNLGEFRRGMLYSPSVLFINGDVRTQGAWYRPEENGGPDWFVVSASNPLLRAFVTPETISSIIAGIQVTIDITPHHDKANSL